MNYDEDYWTEEPDEDGYDTPEDGEDEEHEVYYDPEDKVEEITVGIKLYIRQYMENMAVPIGNRITSTSVDKYVRTISKH